MSFISFRDVLTKPSPNTKVRYGPSELTMTGSLRDWTAIPILDKITVPTLLMNGSEDEVQEVAMQPLFDRIEKVEWITIDDAAHFIHVDQREKFMKYLGAFLAR